MRRTAVAALLVSLLSIHFASGDAAPAAAAVGAYYHVIAPTYVRPGPGNSGVLEAGVELTVALPPEIPPTATAVVAMVQYGDNSTPGHSSLLLATDCTRPPDPVTDGVARIRLEDSGQVGPGVQHQAILPARAGSTCLTSERFSDVWLTLVGYVDGDPSGYAYVDQPDTVLYEGQIPNGGLRLTGLPTDRPYALWVTLDIVPDARFFTEAYVLVGECGTYGYQQVLGTGLEAASAPDTLFGSAILVPPLSDPCVFGTDLDSSIRVELAGTYVSGGTPSPLGPPQIRFRSSYMPGLTAIDPTRVLDTRDPGRAPDPEAIAGEPVTGGDTYRLDLGGVVPIGTTAVALNVTVTEPVRAGFVTVYPCEDSLPLASNLNFTAGLTVPNAVTAALGRSRAVCLYTSATSHLIVDLSGWYRSGEGDGYEPSTPTRAFDTRTVGPRRPAGSTWEADLSALVASDAAAVVMNVTVTEPAFAGFVTVYPCGGAVPTVSNLNFGRGATVANLVTVRLPADKRVCFYTQVPAHLLADVSGSYRRSSHAGLVAFTPSRLFDTREESTTRPASRSTAYVKFTREAVAWMMNVTVTDAGAGGFLTAWNCGLPQPEASNVNYAGGQTVPNLVLAAPVAGARMVCFYVHAATHYLADVTGYFTDERFIVAYEAEGSDSG